MAEVDEDREDLDALTDEEREALAEPGEEEGEAEEQDEGDAEQADATVEAAPKIPAEPVAGAEETEEEAEGPTQAQAPLAAKAPGDAEARGAAIDEREADLKRKLDDGDITTAEFMDGLKVVGKDRSNLEWEVRKAELAAEMTEQARTNAWNKEVADFMTTTGAKLTASRPMMLAFDEVVKAITADPANQSLSDRQMLSKAYRQFEGDLSKMGVTATAPKAPSAPVPAAPKRERNIPPTLARVPSTDIEPTDGGKWAVLDRMADKDPIAYERAVERMSDAERAEYGAVN